MSRRTMLTAWRASQKRNTWRPEDTASWFKLKHTDLGYLNNAEAIDAMLEDHDLLDKGIVRFHATPKGITAWTYNGTTLHRRWKEQP